MNFPSTEFGESVARLCAGTANDDEITLLHAVLRSDQAALDEYLWQVELHARLAQLAIVPGTVNSGWSSLPGDHRLVPAWANGRTQWAAIAALLAIACAVFVMVPTPGPHEKVSGTDARATVPASPSVTPAGATSNEGASPARVGHLAGVYRTTARFAIAGDAPVIVGTGRAEPIALGAEVPHEPGGDTLHVWNWLESPMSRVMKDTRLWPNEVFAVSPDGKTLVWANGKVLDLATGESSKIDLGGHLYLDHQGGQLQRILNLQFTPDGRNLALKLSNVVIARSTHPLRKQDFSTVAAMQVVTFPEGKFVCEFPAGLRMTFSSDATRAVISVPDNESKQQIVEHSAVTGEVLRKYEPRLREFAYAVALSPDASRLAAFDSTGELLIWDSATGELKHRLPIREGSPSDLRFSPDGKLLAISLIMKTWIVDTATGTFVGTVPQYNPGLVRWTPDSQAFDVITSVASGTITEREDAGQRVVFNVFPALKRWTLEETRKK